MNFFLRTYPIKRKEQELCKRTVVAATYLQELELWFHPFQLVTLTIHLHYYKTSFINIRQHFGAVFKTKSAEDLVPDARSYHNPVRRPETKLW